MIKSGLTSITFRQLSVESIVNLVSQAGLDAIEWGGDVHVPPGEINTAKHVHRLTEDAGVEISSYGSYYRLGTSGKEGLNFQQVIETAVTLQAPVVRVWAGSQESDQADDAYLRDIVREACTIADLASEADLSIAFEYHAGSLTHSAASTERLLKTISHPHFSTYWQPIISRSVEDNCQDLHQLHDWISNIHVFHWYPDAWHRCLLTEGMDAWKAYFNILSATKLKRHALLEFVRDDDPDAFLKDAQMLKQLLS